MALPVWVNANDDRNRPGPASPRPPGTGSRRPWRPQSRGVGADDGVAVDAVTGRDTRLSALPFFTSGSGSLASMGKQMAQGVQKMQQRTELIPHDGLNPSFCISLFLLYKMYVATAKPTREITAMVAPPPTAAA